MFQAKMKNNNNDTEKMYNNELLISRDGSTVTAQYPCKMLQKM